MENILISSRHFIIFYLEKMWIWPIYKTIWPNSAKIHGKLTKSVNLSCLLFCLPFSLKIGHLEFFGWEIGRWQQCTEQYTYNTLFSKWRLLHHRKSFKSQNLLICYITNHDVLEFFYWSTSKNYKCELQGNFCTTT